MQNMPVDPRIYAFALISVVLVGLGLTLALHLAHLKRKFHTSQQAANSHHAAQLKALQAANAELERRALESEHALAHVDAQLQAETASRQRIEAVLDAWQAHARALAEAAGAIVWALDTTTHRLLYVSHEIEALLGHPADSWDDLNTWIKRTHPDDREAIAAARTNAMEDGAVHNIKYRLLAADGHVAWVHEAIVKLASKQDSDTLSGFLLDITGAEETASEALTANSSPDDLREPPVRPNAADEKLTRNVFLANMSHELRTPLNGILGYAQILLRDPNLTGRQHEAVRVMQHSGEHLLTLLNDILDISRLENGGLELITTEFQLPNLLRDLVEIFRVSAGEKGLAFHYTVLSDIPAGVTGDERRLRQVLINLLSNAIKFTEQGSVTLKAGIYNDRIRFQIEDTGVGIPPDDVKKLFTPFRQAVDGMLNAGGTGLGLPISRQLIALMGGDLHVESKPGQGSIFWFALDLPEAHDWTVQSKSAFSNVTSYEPPQRKVLVADDGATYRTRCIDILAPLGFALEEAVDGADAVARARSFRPDLILMDVVMPKMDGIAATREILMQPDLKHTVIVAMSTSIFGEDRERSLHAGCADFLVKPLRLDRLLEVLTAQLNLVWRSHDTTGIVAPVDSVSPAIIPPRPVLEELFRLALIGKIVELRSTLDTLSEQNQAYRPFVTEISDLAQNVRLKEVRRRLRAYLESAQ